MGVGKVGSGRACREASEIWMLVVGWIPEAQGRYLVAVGVVPRSGQRRRRRRRRWRVVVKGLGL